MLTDISKEPPFSGWKIKPGMEMSMDIWEAGTGVFSQTGEYQFLHNFAP
jgi:hypothetical protein